MFGRTVHVAVGIDLVTGDRSDVDDVTLPAGDHAGNDGATDVEQALDIRIDHRFPVIDVAVMKFFQPLSEAGIVDQHVDFRPCAVQGLQCFRHRRTIANVEDEIFYVGPVL